MSSATAQTVVLQDVRLIDGTEHPPVDHASIVIEDGKISRIATGKNQHWPAGAQVLKLSGKTVIPGIINGHGHLGQTNGTAHGAQCFTETNIKRQLAQYERYGVTTTISLGLNRDSLYQLKAEEAQGQFEGATILTADRGIGTPGGMPPVNLGPDQVYRPKSPEEARLDVREMAARHPDLVKIWVDDNLHTLPKPNSAVFGAVIDEAHKNSLRVAAHVYYLADAKWLLRDGVDILAHSVRDQVLDNETIHMIKNRGVYYIPTLQLEESFYVYAEHQRWMETPFFKNAITPDLEQMFASPAFQQKVENDKTTPIHKKALATAMTNVRKLYDAGALIAFGTDSGANPLRIQGFAEHRELQLMVASGMTPLEAIHSATEVNARMLHIDAKTGTIEPGKQADLIVLDADPSRDILNARRIAMVFHRGRQVKL